MNTFADRLFCELKVQLKRWLLIFCGLALLFHGVGVMFVSSYHGWVSVQNPPELRDFYLSAKTFALTGIVWVVVGFPYNWLADKRGRNV